MDKSEFYREARTDLTGPLSGVRVLEATTTWAGPMCGCLLADFGADVVKVELPEGEVARKLPPFLPGVKPPLSFAHATVNRNKRGITLDLAQGEGREIFLKLAAKSDIIVENFRPGTMSQWGIGYADARQVKADIIYVSITGFGQFGPNHDQIGYDPLAQASGGFMSLNGDPDGPPVKASTYLADDLSGMHGAMAALAALAHRARTGEGQYIDVALLDSLLFCSNGNLTLGAMGVPLPRMGNGYMFAAPAGAFACRDGYVYLGVLLDSHWRIFAPLIGRADLADHPEYGNIPGRLKHRADVDRIVADWCADRAVSEIIELFISHGIAAAQVRTYEQTADDPHVQERDMLQPTEQPDGATIPITGPAAKFSRTPTRVRHAAPDLGAHTDEVLTELGMNETDISRLRDNKIV